MTMYQQKKEEMFINKLLYMIKNYTRKKNTQISCIESYLKPIIYIYEYR